jgi:hypothetical protein
VSMGIPFFVFFYQEEGRRCIPFGIMCDSARTSHIKADFSAPTLLPVGSTGVLPRLRRIFAAVFVSPLASAFLRAAVHRRCCSSFSFCFDSYDVCAITLGGNFDPGIRSVLTGFPNSSVLSRVRQRSRLCGGYTRRPPFRVFFRRLIDRHRLVRRRRFERRLCRLVCRRLGETNGEFLDIYIYI